MARVLFYVPIAAPDRKNYIPFHRGAAQIAAVLKRHGHQVAIRMPFAATAEGVKRQLDRLRPDVVFLSLATTQAALLEVFARAALHADLPLLLGGPHATFVPREVLSVPGVTAVCRGDGEEAALAFLRNDWGFPGLVRPGEKLSAARPVDVARLPLPDRHAVYRCPDFTLRRDIVGHEFLAARGCPFACTYCSTPAYHALSGGPRLRRLPVDLLVREAREALALDPDVRIVGFHDDTFTADRAFLRAFATKWRSSVGLPFWVNAHPDLLDEERVGLLKHAGCRRVHVGVETGDENLRRRVLSRAVSNDTILRAAQRLRHAGLRLVTFVMLGIPHETEETYRATCELLRELKPDWIIQSYFLPLPGTALGEEVRAQLPVTSWKEVVVPSFYNEPAASYCPELSVQRLREMGRDLLRAVYKR